MHSKNAFSLEALGKMMQKLKWNNHNNNDADDVDDEDHCRPGTANDNGQWT